MTDPSAQPTEEEMRAAYEAELKRVRIEDVLVQTLVSLINIGGRKAGLAPGAEDERDPEQVRQAIEGVRALMPLVQEALGPDLRSVQDALSQLQIAYAKLSGSPPAAAAPAAEPPEPPAPPPSRLWVPGQ